MDSRGAQVRSANFEILGEGLHRRGILVLVAIQQILGDHIAHASVRGVVGALHHGSDFGPDIIKHFVQHVTGLMGEAALAQAIGPVFFNGSDQSWGPIGGDQDRCIQTSTDHVPDEVLPGAVTLLVAQRHVQKHFPPMATSLPSRDRRPGSRPTAAR